MPETARQGGPKRRRTVGLAAAAGLIGLVVGAVHGTAPAPASGLRQVDSSYLCGIEGCNHNQVLL